MLFISLLLGVFSSVVMIETTTRIISFWLSMAKWLVTVSSVPDRFGLAFEFVQFHGRD